VCVCVGGGGGVLGECGFFCVEAATVSIIITAVFHKTEFQTRRQRKIFISSENYQIIEACLGHYYINKYTENYYSYCLTIPGVFFRGEKHLDKSISRKFWFHVRSTEIQKSLYSRGICVIQNTTNCRI
jgi:hypothetical protein